MRDFLRAGSIPICRSVEGTGIPPGIEDYPFQGLAIETTPYDYGWLQGARIDANRVFRGLFDGPAHSAGALKHPGRTPLGTPVAELARKGHDMLAAPCGLCGRNLAACGGQCGAAGDAE